MHNIFVGRQPIYNRNVEVIGYELLFRPYEGEKANVIDGDYATSQVILNTFMEIGLEEIVGEGLAFINLTRSFIEEKYPIPLLQNRVVLEVLEDINIDKNLIDSLNDLSKRGFQIALDDVINPSDIDPLLGVANIVKLDLMGLEFERLPEYVATLRCHKLKLLAEKVETQAEFDHCMELGFDYFQGFFLSRPNIV